MLTVTALALLCSLCAFVGYRCGHGIGRLSGFDEGFKHGLTVAARRQRLELEELRELEN